MLHLGETGLPMFPEDFEAWDYGPVVPSLYHDLKMFGGGPVAPYSSLRPVRNLDDKVGDAVNQVVALGRTRTPGNLVSMTHWPKGAWSQVYKRHVKGLTIPKLLIRSEFNQRVKDAAEHA